MVVQELLFLSKQAVFQPPTAIRGGIPVCWPQFSDMGQAKTAHGFARNLTWEIEQQAPDAVTMTLVHSDATLAQYPHPFKITLAVVVGEGSLTQTFTVTNTGSAPMPFTAALHTYFRLHDASAAAVRGLQGVRYLDSLQQRKEVVDVESEVTFPGEVDRIYCNAPDELVVADGDGALMRVAKTSFPDVVVWNPAAAKAARMSDFGDDEWKEMICAEVAQAGSGPISLGPGEEWAATQVLEVVNS